MEVVALTIWVPGARPMRTLHTTGDGAYFEVIKFVEDCWDSDLIGREIEEFDSNKDRVDCFFDTLDPDYKYIIEKERVRGPEVAEEPPLGPDEVILTPEEVTVTVHALGLARGKELAFYTKMSRDKAVGVRDSAWRKLRD